MTLFSQPSSNQILYFLNFNRICSSNNNFNNIIRTERISSFSYCSCFNQDRVTFLTFLLSQYYIPY
jgi:hypothetical protein